MRFSKYSLYLSIKQNFYLKTFFHKFWKRNFNFNMELVLLRENTPLVFIHVFWLVNSDRAFPPWYILWHKVFINPLSTNPSRWPTNCLSVFDHFAGLVQNEVNPPENVSKNISEMFRFFQCFKYSRYIYT